MSASCPLGLLGAVHCGGVESEQLGVPLGDLVDHERGTGRHCGGDVAVTGNDHDVATGELGVIELRVTTSTPGPSVIDMSESTPMGKATDGRWCSAERARVGFEREHGGSG